jgi:hypothetical protein
VALRRTLLPALGVVCLLTACGPPAPATPNHFTADATRKCLKSAGLGVSTNPKDLGGITAAAPAGGLRVYLVNNSLTIAYADDEQGAIQIANGFRRVATTPHERKRLNSLLERTGNAVVVWISEPRLQDVELIRGCLK